MVNRIGSVHGPVDPMDQSLKSTKSFGLDWKMGLQDWIDPSGQPNHSLLQFSLGHVATLPRTHQPTKDCGSTSTCPHSPPRSKVMSRLPSEQVAWPKDQLCRDNDKPPADLPSQVDTWGWLCGPWQVCNRVSTTPVNPGNLLEFNWSSWKFLCKMSKIDSIGFQS